MNWSGLMRGACVAAALFCLGSPQTRALEIVTGASPAHLDDGMISKAYVARRGGAYHRGVYRGPRGGVYRGGTVYRGGAYRGGVYRGGAYGYRGGYGYRAGYGGWARPGWYRWPAGGAIAAGAAIAPPAPGLCWYYTDPSRTQGFWDACQ